MGPKCIKKYFTFGQVHSDDVAVASTTKVQGGTASVRVTDDQRLMSPGACLGSVTGDMPFRMIPALLYVASCIAERPAIFAFMSAGSVS